MVKSSSDFSSNTTIDFYNAKPYSILDLFVINKFFMLSKSVHRNRPHHWCSPPAHDVLSLRTICAVPLHQIISQTVKYSLIEV